MLSVKYRLSVCGLAAATALTWGGFSARADHGKGERDPHGRTVFVIAMENHNWTQPAATTSPRPIFMNPQAPFINSLVNGTSGISQEVAYATHYINSGVGVHPSEPNYIWAEAGTNFAVFNDDTPYHADCSPDSVDERSAPQRLPDESAPDMEVVSGGHRRRPHHQRPVAARLVDGSALQPERCVHRRRAQRLLLGFHLPMASRSTT
jgi:hypothetical protein